MEFEFGAYEEFIYKRTYARWLEDENRRENFNESVERFKSFFENYANPIKNEFEDAIDKFKSLNVMPSMRAFYSAGKALEENNIAGYNCCFITMDNQKRFGELLLILMNGTGVGFSVERQLINSLPIVPKLKNIDKTIVFEDSKYGWAKGFQEFVDELYNGNICNYDLSLIRAKGERLKTFGGRASGPEPLELLLKHTERIFKKSEERKLRSIEVHDINCYIANAVVVGGVRRSSCISLSNLSDDRMKIAKDGEFWIQNSQRFLSNNSVAYTEKPDMNLFINEWISLMKSGTGERGIFNRKGCEKIIKKTNRRKIVDNIGVNPCCEVILRPQEFCVSENTPLMTSKGIFNINELENKNVDVWNGKEWTSVIVRKTGSNQKMVRVTMTDGSFLDCTEDHYFSIKDRFKKEWEKIKAKDINSYSKYSIQNEPSNMIHHNNGNFVENAYDYGFAIGDGHTENNTVYVDLYGSKQNCPVKGYRHKEYTPIGYNTSKIRVKTNLDIKKYLKLKNDINGFRDIYKWDRESILNFVAGLADADGSNASNGIRIYQGSYDKLSNLQLILTMCGIKSSINLMQKKGIKTNYGIRKNDIYYIQIPNCVEIPCRRLNTKNGKQEKFKGKYQNIKSIEFLPDKYDSFCFNEPKRHKAVFGNILTYQCNLSEVVIRPNDSLDDLKEKIKSAVVFGCLQSLLTNFKYISDEYKNNCEEERLLGVSLTGLRDHEILKSVSKESKKYLKEMKTCAVSYAKEISKKLNINIPGAITSVKPSGCTTLETKIKTSKGIKSMAEIFSLLTFDNFFEKNAGSWIIPVKSLSVYDENNNLKEITKLFINGLSEVYEIEDEQGNIYKFTGEHKLKTYSGWKRVDELDKSDNIVSF